MIEVLLVLLLMFVWGVYDIIGNIELKIEYIRKNSLKEED